LRREFWSRAAGLAMRGADARQDEARVFLPHNRA